MPEPFNFGVSTLVEAEYKQYIEEKFGESTRVTDTREVRPKDARSNCIGALIGTATHWREVKEEEIRHKHRLANFRTKMARDVRDEGLRSQNCGFMHQVYRFRGKANYRDCLYFGYGEESRHDMKRFLQDLDRVLSAYLGVAAFYCFRRLEKNIWQDFVDDLSNNAWLKDNARTPLKLPL